MESVLVVGAGTMGHGISQVCAQAGYQVCLTDVKEDALNKALNDITWSLKKFHGKGLLKESPETILERIRLERGLESAKKAKWVIEAAPEIEKLKRELFQTLDNLAPVGTILASNTSVIPISRIAQATKHPDRVIGLHFFTPVAMTAIVEVIKGKETSNEVFEQAIDFVDSLGKWPLRVQKDIPGFLMNRIQASNIREVVNLLAEGMATPEDLDKGVKLAYGWAVGPCEAMDYAGLDTFAHVRQSLKELGEEELTSRFDVIERLVKQGRLGRKVGRGFYRYTEDGKRLPWSIEDEIPSS